MRSREERQNRRDKNPTHKHSASFKDAKEKRLILIDIVFRNDPVLL
jgi:hypothetical protein